MQQPPSKIWGPVKPPFFQIWLEAQPPPPCFVLTLYCLRPGLCVGWVSGLLCWGVGRSTCWEGNFYWICRRLICNFTEYVSFLRVFFIHFAEADYLPGFCVDQCPGEKGLIVTWRQILNCDMTRESMHMGDREHTHICVHIWVTRTCMSVCMWLFTCTFVRMRHNNF